MKYQDYQITWQDYEVSWDKEVSIYLINLTLDSISVGRTLTRTTIVRLIDSVTAQRTFVGTTIKRILDSVSQYTKIS